MNTVIRSFMPVEQLDWIQVLTDEIEASKQTAKLLEDAKVLRGKSLEEERGKYVVFPSCHSSQAVTGLLVWRCDHSSGRWSVTLLSEKSPKLEGAMGHHDGSRFVVRWTDRSLEADAYVLFERGQNDRVVGISMTKLDPGDFDFEDLNLSRVE